VKIKTILNPALNYAPESVRHIHLMGICGTAMAALAGMLQQEGYKVTGSDSHVYPPMSTFLQKLGIDIFEGYKADNLNCNPDLVIVGNVITQKNPEAIALSKTTLPYISLPQALEHLFIATRKSLVVAGTHGKTTSCSMLAASLYHLGLDPTFMIGGIVREFEANFRIGTGPYFVAEGDEYDTAFFDKESKFLHYQPHVAILTSIEFDHADIFADLEAIKKAFRKFVRLIPKDGLLIANFDDPHVVDVANEAECPIQSYGVSDQHFWRFANASFKEGITSFDVYKEGNFWDKMTVRMAGHHNCMNSLAVCAALHHIGVKAADMQSSLAAFAGVKRRQEVRGIVGGVTVIDDFAHHPTAVRETVAALATAYSQSKLIIVFEPRTNSSRRKIFQKDYASAFDAADHVLLKEPIPIQDLPAEQLFSSAQLAGDINLRHIPAEAFQTTDEILARLKTLTRPGDVVAILSNGGFDNIHTRLLAQLENH